ncbi:MAG: SIMPL domain-containing protein [Minisyncoccia bacterium]
MLNDFLNDSEGKRPIRLAVTVVLSMLALFLLVSTINGLRSFGHPAALPTNAITVEGVGKATAVPDIAEISFTVMETASTVEVAQTAATKKNNAALAFLKEQKIDEKDIQTTSYNVSPQYEYPRPCPVGAMCPDYIDGNPKITGYQVSQTITVKVRDTAETGAILQGLGSLEVQNIYGPNFVVDNDASIKDEARAAAIADAKGRAEMIAKQLGVHLGDVIGYSEGGYYPMYDSYGKGGGMMETAVSSVPPRLPAGEQETTVNVSITYEIR